MITLAHVKAQGLFLGGSLSKGLLYAVPSVSARTLGFYRILFGSIFLTFFWVQMSPPHLGSLAEDGPRFFLNSWSLLSDLSAKPLVQSTVYYSVVLSLCFFTAGLFTRVSFACLVVGFWFTALLSNSGHFITPLLLAVTVTLGARWGAGLSLDQILFRSHGDSGRSAEFGYPIWLMGLCISLAYTSAGLSKLYLTDGAWIWEGGTRWGFITDMRDAATLWGSIIVNNLPIAILASIFAAFGQTFYVYSCFTRSLLIKSAIGLLIAIPFLIGLLLFMGLFWWPWFVLVLLWFLPWAKIDDFIGGSLAKATEREPGTRQRNMAVCTAAVLIFGHAYVVVRGIEFEPLFSNYPMYAVAYPMGSELEKRRWNEYKESNPDYVYDVTVETPDGRVAEIGHRYRASTILVRFLDIASPYWRAKPNSIWTSAERGETPGSLCDLQRKVLADFGPGEGTADLVYRRSYFDLVDGRLLWSSRGKRLRVTVESDHCSYLWVEDAA